MPNLWSFYNNEWDRANLVLISTLKTSILHYLLNTALDTTIPSPWMTINYHLPLYKYTYDVFHKTKISIENFKYHLLQKTFMVRFSAIFYSFLSDINFIQTLQGVWLLYKGFVTVESRFLLTSSTLFQLTICSFSYSTTVLYSWHLSTIIFF